MSYIAILSFLCVYMFSFVGIGIYVDEGLEAGRLTATEYRKGTRLAFIPVINTLALALCLASALVHWLSFGMWNKPTK